MISPQFDNKTDNIKTRNNAMHKKIIAVLSIALVMAVALNLVFAISVFSDKTEMKSDSGKTENADKIDNNDKESKYDLYVETAIDMVEEKWDAFYSSHPSNKQAGKDGVVKILNTRIVYIKDNAVSDFENVDFIVEFILHTDFYGSSPYYVDAHRDCSVVFYKDGTKEVADGNMVTSYILRTGDLELTDILEDVEDLGAEYNRTLR